MAEGVQPARKGRVGPCGDQPSVTSEFPEEEGVGVGPGREEARVWTFHAIQTQRTRAAEEPRAGRGAGSCFLGWTGSNSVLFSLERSGKLASSWQYWGKEIRAFLLVQGDIGELRDNGDREGRSILPCWAQAGPGTRGGAGISLVWSGLCPCEVLIFGPGELGVPISTPVL